MKTPEEISLFKTQLEAAGISLTSPPAHRAIGEFKDNAKTFTSEALVLQAVNEERINRDAWIELALAPWCKRHGITLEQGASIVAQDDAYNPDEPGKDLVTYRSLFAWSGQQNDFAAKILKTAKDVGPTEIALRWHIDDVLVASANTESGIKPSEEQAREVLKRVKLNHSATEGVSWDVINHHLEAVLEEDSIACENGAPQPPNV